MLITRDAGGALISSLLGARVSGLPSSLVGGIRTLEVTALVGSVFAANDFAANEGQVVERHRNVGSAMTSAPASATWKRSPATSVSCSRVTPPSFHFSGQWAFVAARQCAASARGIEPGEREARHDAPRLDAGKLARPPRVEATPQGSLRHLPQLGRRNHVNQACI
jgi:hypothetical protein